MIIDRKFEKGKCNDVLAKIRRRFKFMSEDLAGRFGLVTTMLDAMGFGMTGQQLQMEKGVEKLVETIKARAINNVAVYRLICMAVNEERSQATKNIKDQLKSKFEKPSDEFVRVGCRLCH